MLCHMALMLHLLHSRFPTLSTRLLETDDFPIAYNKVNVLVLNIQLQILCPIIVFNLVLPWLHSFACTMSSISIPSSYKLVLSSFGWKRALGEEMSALHKNQTWELTTFPPGKHTVGCRWVYTVKYHPDGFVECLKARLIGFQRLHTDIWC